MSEAPIDMSTEFLQEENRLLKVLVEQQQTSLSSYRSQIETYKRMDGMLTSVIAENTRLRAEQREQEQTMRQAIQCLEQHVTEPDQNLDIAAKHILSKALGE